MTIILSTMVCPLYYIYLSMKYANSGCKLREENIMEPTSKSKLSDKDNADFKTNLEFSKR